jgi:L-amino acid N-acyltransferase YncA
MTIRPALFTDVPRLAELVGELHARSIYAGRAEFDTKAAKALMMSSIQRHGFKTDAGTLVLVTEKAGVVEGFIIGVLSKIYQVLDKLVATDFMFYCSDRADPGDALKLLRRLVSWARKNPNVIEIVMALPSVVEPWQRTAPLYERVGFTRCGALFEMRTDT